MSEFAEVTKEAFFAYMNPRNVHPHPERTYTAWVFQPTRQTVGKSDPGYIPDGTPKRWFLRKEASA